MANTFLTPDIIAREALMVLQNNLVLANLVHRDYSQEFTGAKKGDTITIRKPATFTVGEFATEISVQTATEASTTVTLDKHLDVSFAVTSKDLTLEIESFSEQLLQPAMMAFAQDIDNRIALLYKDIPYKTGTAGTTPAGVAAITGLRKVMNDNKVPFAGRNLVLDTAADAALLGLDTFIEVDKAGSAAALTDARLGRKFGFDIYTDQNIKTHTAGAGTVLIDLTGGYAAGATALHVDGVSAALKVGDLLTIGGNSHVVTVASALSTADQDITIYPGLKAAVADDAAVTLAASHAANLAFHRNAFAMVSVPLALPMGTTNASYVNYNGIGLRVVYGYNQTTKTDTVSIDMLCGFKTLTPELACVLLG